MRVVNNISELVGDTPIVKLNRVIGEDKGNVYVKLEYFNPASSVKDRIALNMIEKAEEEGVLKKGSVIVEPTSGNTGVGIAMIGAAKGYKVIIVMPDTMSIERRMLVKAFGAELILTEGTKGMKGAIDKANELIRENDNYTLLQQFENPHNPGAHLTKTAYEILDQLNDKLDYFVAGVGTGGTITGVGKILKEKLPHVRIVAVEPEESSVISGNQPGPHKIQGIGAGFIPKVLDMDIIDHIEVVTYEESVSMMKRLASEEGILVGISSGAAISRAVSLAKNLDSSQNLVVIAPDTGERYLSTKVFD